MSSNSSKFQKATFEVRFIPVPHCGVEEIACWCDLLAIEEVSRRLVLNYRIRLHCGSSFDFVGGAVTFIPSHVGFLRPWRVVFRQACLMHLIEQFHGGMMLCTNSNDNMRKWEAG